MRGETLTDTLMKTLPKSLSIAFLAVSIFIAGVNVDFVGAQNTAGEKKVVLELSDEERAWLDQGHTVRVRVGYAPPMMLTTPAPSGICVDYLKQIGKILGLKFVFIPASIKWPKSVEDLMGERKHYDLLPTLKNTPVRAEKIAFTKDYIYVNRVVITRKDEASVRNFEDLKGKTVSVERGYVLQKRLQKEHADIKLLVVDTTLDALMAVAGGEVDGYIGNLFRASYHIAKQGLHNLEIVAFAPFGRFDLAMAIRKDWTPLVSMINKALEAIPEEMHIAIRRKWTPVSVDTGKLQRSIAPPFPFTPEEQAWLAQNRTVRVRIVDWPPYLTVKGNEPPQGIVIEYLKLIEERTGIKFKFEVTDQPFAEFLEGMKQRQGPDMTAVIMPTPEREQYLSFSEPYLAAPQVIFIREQGQPILDISGIIEKTIAVPRGFVVHTQLVRHYPEIRLALFDSDEGALEAVATGQADAYIGNLTVASHIIHRRGFSSLHVAAAAPFKEQPLSMGNRNDWPELTSIINKALASITEEEKTAIRNKYLAIKYEPGIDKAEVLKWVLVFGGAVLGIVLIFLFWNRRLSREIGKRKQTEENLKLARDDAEAANRAKSIFLANMSHELRTPLNAVLGFSGMLAREGDATADQQEKLGIINRSGQHLLSMINDVLDLSKIEAGRVVLQESFFDLVALIEEVGMMVQARAVEKKIFVVMEAETVSFPYVKADMGKFRQMLINLLNNAVKFTDEGGVTLRCATEPIPEEPKRCHIMIEVEDTGPGIDPAIQAKIFEPFVQGIGVAKRKGTGLGLSICKKFADLMGGTLEVESEVGKGSLFRIRLPAEIAEAADVKASIDDKPRVIGLAPTQKTWRILVADDNRENRIVLKFFLEKAGFLVLEAENGKEAVATFQKELPDLIWMDMRMPVIDGYEAVRQIRKCSGGDTVPIIAITASAFSEQRHEILAAGCDDVVVKPFREQEIFEVMGRSLDIEYIYEPEREAAPSRKGETDLTSAMLADLPADLLQELREATLALNRETALEVIARIADHAPEVATGLKELVDNYQMSELHDLLEDVD
jgi:signal transduction histidine kinase/CheY-like chemotaxis protein